MRLIRRGIRAVDSNVRPLAHYLAISVGSSVLVLVASFLLDAEPSGDAPASLDSLRFLFSVSSGLFLCVAMAAAQTLAFPRFGEALGSPLWTVTGVRDARLRFFRLWLLVNLLSFMALLLPDVIYRLISRDAAGFSLLVALPVLVLAVPVGTILMFLGRNRWPAPGAVWAVAAAQPAAFAGLVAFNGLLLFSYVFLIAQFESRRWVWPLLDVIYGYFECVVFCATWALCIGQHLQDCKLDSTRE